MPRFIKHSQKPKAIDGFIASGPRQPIAPRGADGFSGQLIRPQGNHLDDFNKPEGFRGRTNPKLTQTSQYAQPAQTPRGHFGKRRVVIGQPTSPQPFKKPRKGLKILLRMTLIVVVAVLLMGGYLFGKAWWNAHKIFQGGGTALAFDANLDPALLTGEGDGRVNILLIGKPGTGRPGEGGPDATDSLMIVSLDIANKELGLLSIPRDLPVDPDDMWSMKINAVYVSAKIAALNSNPDDQDGAEMAGLNKLCEVVEEYMGVPINYYGLIDFSAFEEVVDTLGGITITLPEAFYDSKIIIGGQNLSLPAGTQQINGVIALSYARARYADNRDDFGRGERQQTVLVAIKDKAISVGTFANPLKISGLLDVLGERVSTNLSIDDMMKVYNFIKDVSPENIKNYTLADEGEEVVNGSAAPINGYDEVRAFVREKLKDGFITQENPSIIVLNGTTEPGLAQQRADVLTGYGYNVIQVADAPISVAATQVIDKTNGQKPYTLRYMELRYNTESVANIEGLALSTYQADFIIVVGP